jgi:bifunctional UDP-N-acetylglucosamine pyrophosphorylase/glucosamine-1-phosphate N-acetyltransferase/UDP-N-acetylglucosamine pyrophosphorylase
MPYLPDHVEEVVILCGDVPLLTSKTVIQFIDNHKTAKRDISILAVEMAQPKGYGRILLDEYNHVSGIVEEADASKQQKQIKIINTGIYCAKKEFLLHTLPKIKPDNVQGEFYLTDIIDLGYRKGKIIGVMVAIDDNEFIGVNNLEDLAKAETILRNR